LDGDVLDESRVKSSHQLLLFLLDLDLLLEDEGFLLLELERTGGLSVGEIGDEGGSSGGGEEGGSGLDHLDGGNDGGLLEDGRSGRSSEDRGTARNEERSGSKEKVSEHSKRGRGEGKTHVAEA